MERLKLCPFCGGEEIDCTNYCRGGDVWFVQCANCYATFPHFDSKEEAIEAWNKRYEPTTPGGAYTPARGERLNNA